MDTGLFVIFTSLVTGITIANAIMAFAIVNAVAEGAKGRVAAKRRAVALGLYIVITSPAMLGMWWWWGGEVLYSVLKWIL